MKKLTREDCALLIQQKGKSLSIPSVNLMKGEVDESKSVSALYVRLKEKVSVPTSSPEHRSQGDKGDILMYQPLTRSYFVISGDYFDKIMKPNKSKIISLK